MVGAHIAGMLMSHGGGVLSVMPSALRSSMPSTPGLAFANCTYCLSARGFLHATH